MVEYQRYGLVEGSSAREMADLQPELMVRVLGHYRTNGGIRSNARIIYDALGIESVIRGLREGTTAGMCHLAPLGPAGALCAMGSLAAACVVAVL